jgi:hypothetical protein
MSTPTVFLSAASDDLKDWRDILHKAFERAGCKVFAQGQSLGAAAGDVLRLLRQHLDKSDFVIRLAGLAYGVDPDQPAVAEHPEFQCSYTQYEYYYAHLHRKQLIAFVCAVEFPYLQFTEKGADDADRERRRMIRPAVELKSDVSRIIKYAPAELIGREAEIALLDDAWDQACRRVAGVGIGILANPTTAKSHLPLALEDALVCDNASILRSATRHI